MQESSATPKNQRCRAWVVAFSQSSSQCLLTVFGAVSSLHPTSFLIHYAGLAVSVARDEMIIRIHTYAHAYCARKLQRKLLLLINVYVQSTIKWRRSKRKSPRWTWILLSEGQTLPWLGLCLLFPVFLYSSILTVFTQFPI